MRESAFDRWWTNAPAAAECPTCEGTGADGTCPTCGGTGIAPDVEEID